MKKQKKDQAHLKAEADMPSEAEIESVVDHQLVPAESTVAAELEADEQVALEDELDLEAAPESEIETVEVVDKEGKRRRFRRRIKRLKIDVYDGYGTSELLVIKGRVFSDRRVDAIDENDSRFRNLVNTSKRFIANEAEKVWVQVCVREHLQEVQTDHEGIYRASFENIADVPYGLHSFTVTISDQNKRRYQAEPAVGQYVLHDPGSDRVSIISDVDDTILLTEASSKVRMLRNVFLKNHFTQSAVAGMSDLYRAIHYGPEGDGYDATHYVSSSPDNLYSRINRFLDHQKFPAGSIDLKNIGLRKGHDSLFDHETYKLARIRSIMSTFPKRRFVLFGDSGEHDPQIYRKISQEFKGQILAIYIHNVNNSDPYHSRFDGQMLFTSIDKVRRDLIKRGLIYP